MPRWGVVDQRGSASSYALTNVSGMLAAGSQLASSRSKKRHFTRYDALVTLPFRWRRRRASSVSINFSSEAFEVQEGPLQRMIIPIGHSRQAGSHRRFSMYLKCELSTREVAFEPVLRAFDAADTLEDILEEV